MNKMNVLYREKERRKDIQTQEGDKVSRKVPFSSLIPTGALFQSTLQQVKLDEAQDHLEPEKSDFGGRG